LGCYVIQGPKHRHGIRYGEYLHRVIGRSSFLINASDIGGLLVR
jgi:hypothetical protein